jgi:N-methylhydantoinase B
MGRVSAARIAVGACSAVAQRLPALEAALEGVRLAEAARVPSAAHLAALSPIDDIRASAAYRRDAALTLLRDLLEGLAA